MTTALSAACRVLFVSIAMLALSACSGSQHGEADAGHDNATSSSAGLPPGHADIGAKLAHAKGKATGQSCVDCHGEGGNAPIDPTYPSIGGQYGDYIAHALTAYRNGHRQHPLMSPQAAGLGDQDIADLAAYFSSQPTHLRDLQGIK